jgi:hypothetical protein
VPPRALGSLRLSIYVEASGTSLRCLWGMGTASAVRDAFRVWVPSLAGLFWWQIGGSLLTSDAGNVIGLLFFEALFLAFRAMFAALFTFPNEFKMMLKVRQPGSFLGITGM